MAVLKVLVHVMCCTNLQFTLYYYST